MLLIIQPTSPVANYTTVGVLLVAVVAVVSLMLLASHGIGMFRHGRVKDMPYESGMPVIQDARRRFNVKFYIIAMLFLLFDVEIVFLWPWAPIYHRASTDPDGALSMTLAASGYGAGFLLIEMALFLAILLVGYVYAWRKGVFNWS